MQRRDFVRLLGGAALEAFGVSPAFGQSSGTCGVPVARDDAWPIASDADGNLIDRGALCEMTDQLTASSANVHAVLVARGGKLVFERYLSGSDEIYSRPVGRVTFNADTLHDMKSVSKSVASLAVGIAIDRGLIGSVNEPIFNFFPELSDLRTPEKDRIQLVHALTMSMGLKWVEAAPSTEGDNDEERMRRARDPCRYVLGLAVTAPAGREFFYNTGALALVAAIIRKATGHPLDEFARAALLDPLGITGATWLRVKGDTDAGGGLRLRPRDMAKIGQLVLAGGRWNDRQIVPKSWIETSTAPKIAATDGLLYGYLWWLGRSQLDGREIPWIMAVGRGGQLIRIVPELDLVFAMTAGYYQDYSPPTFRVRETIFRAVLRAASQTR